MIILPKILSNGSQLQYLAHSKPTIQKTNVTKVCQGDKGEPRGPKLRGAKGTVNPNSVRLTGNSL